MRFPKQIRLTRRSDFQRVYKNGRRARGIHFVVFFDTNHLSYSRFGMTVSKKLGSAVRRNRIKRIFREALRSHQGEAMPGFDFVFNPHPSAAKLKCQALAEDVARVLSQLKGKYDASVGVKRA
ncbi:MAG: ribonuclease P protein component [Acidobacteriia bacterium]|nr:ribonuclease P protein component [Terriglobia bacterium]